MVEKYDVELNGKLTKKTKNTIEDAEKIFTDDT